MGGFKHENEEVDLPERLNIGVIKYFWQSSPYNPSKKTTIPHFLRNIIVFKDFSDYERYILSKFIHERTYDNGEIIFKQGDLGIGFYLIYFGNVEIIVEKENPSPTSTTDGLEYNLVTCLETKDYFGELALLQENSIRSATAIAKNACKLIGIFKPDLDELIRVHPVVATKLLQSVSMIIAERLYSITKEVKILKYKLSKMEQLNENEVK